MFYHVLSFLHGITNVSFFSFQEHSQREARGEDHPHLAFVDGSLVRPEDRRDPMLVAGHGGSRVARWFFLGTWGAQLHFLNSSISWRYGCHGVPGAFRG